MEFAAITNSIFYIIFYIYDSDSVIQSQNSRHMIHDVLNQISDDLTTHRPILEASELWQQEKLEQIAWMFDGSKSVDEETKLLINYRDTLGQKAISMKAILSHQPAVKKNNKLFGLLAKFGNLYRDMEDFSFALLGDWSNIFKGTYTVDEVFAVLLQHRES